MTKISQPLPRAAEQIGLLRMSPKVTLLQLGQARILFFADRPIATVSGGYVSFNCEPGSQRAAVNAWMPDAPQVQLPAEEFDFVVGQILTSAGLPLTRAPKKDDIVFYIGKTILPTQEPGKVIPSSESDPSNS